jgi:hypoxanthine phosphoribosyltransferase
MEKTIEVCYNELKSADKKEVWIMANNCETCVNYEYDEEYDYYVCAKNLDVDEMYRFIKGDFRDCPYYQFGDEYQIVKKQM